jgi:uncharacterized pyridoxamine 5'-phosphate oxidase family protein
MIIKENNMDLNNYKELLEKNPSNIATVNNKNCPNISIASNIRVIESDSLIISVNEMENTPNNIKENPNIAFTTFDKEWNGVRIFGTAKYYTSGEYYDFCYETFFKNRVSPKGLTKPKGAIVVKVNKIEEIK